MVLEINIVLVILRRTTSQTSPWFHPCKIWLDLYMYIHVAIYVCSEWQTFFITSCSRSNAVHSCIAWIEKQTFEKKTYPTLKYNSHLCSLSKFWLFQQFDNNIILHSIRKLDAMGDMIEFFQTLTKTYCCNQLWSFRIWIFFIFNEYTFIKLQSVYLIQFNENLCCLNIIKHNWYEIIYKFVNLIQINQ